MYRIGIDLGGTNMKAGIVDENHKIVIQDSIPTRVEHPYKEIIRDMAELVKDLLKKIHITEEKLSGLKCGMTFDAVTVSIEDAISHLLELTGERTSDEVVDRVFHNFCVGK